MGGLRNEDFLTEFEGTGGSVGDILLFSYHLVSWAFSPIPNTAKFFHFFCLLFFFFSSGAQEGIGANITTQRNE